MADEDEEKRRETDIIQMVTCQAPVNIAVIKYCKNKDSMLKTLFFRAILNIFKPYFFSGGKRDEELILPLNSSLSVTLGIDEVTYP